MLKITFKNVGHGDSIILEWDYNKIRKIAIIDCNINIYDNNKNPVLDYIIDHKEYKEIEFLILSHPHYDHYSGMRSLLEYCQENRIFINNFLHTSYQVPEYLKTAVKSYIAEKELIKLFLKVKELWLKEKIIKDYNYIHNNYKELKLTDDINLKFISPTTLEFTKYKENKDYTYEEDDHNNGKANLLSTLIKIYNLEWCILLTSDCEKEVLNYFFNNENNTVLFCGQSPHHGAKNNHNSDFWKTINRNNKSSIAFSAGQNSYNHPSEEVIRFFEDENYKIHYTNKVGGLLLINHKIKENNALLNLTSTFISSNFKEFADSSDSIFQVN